jgi:hypothetical protein
LSQRCTNPGAKLSAGANIIWQFCRRRKVIQNIELLTPAPKLLRAPLADQVRINRAACSRRLVTRYVNKCVARARGRSRRIVSQNSAGSAGVKRRVRFGISIVFSKMKT